ncbi:MAG: hypothetical protein ACW98D_15375 [Promethearchaeota archaeon]|jgi:hypothetical protein
MIDSSYYDYIYKVNGETIKLRPEKMFDPSGVYLIVDVELELIWIWAGSHSRLFHRYMAANWAGKLKTKKKFYNFKYEVVKQGIEPSEFHIILNEIKENAVDLSYPGQSRQKDNSNQISESYITPTSTPQPIQTMISKNQYMLTKTERSQMRKLFNEVREIQMHIKYSMDRINERFVEIEKILAK